MKQSIKPCNQPREKAVAPDKGAAAFFCSTESKGLSVKARTFFFYPHFPASDRPLQNFLPNKHYFRPGLVGGTTAVVLLSEGQEKPLASQREVAV